MARKKKKERKVKPPIEYSLRPSDFQGFRLLACDPGSRNFGIAVVGVDNDRPVVLANAVLMYPINDLVTFSEKRVAFQKELDMWMKVYRPQAMIGERFQTRGNGGPLIEQVSVMLGLLAGRYDLPMRLITASTWKNKFNRRFGAQLSRIIKDGDPILNNLYQHVPITPHAFDASLIGTYGLEYGFKKDLRYDPRTIIKGAVAASMMPPVEPKKGRRK